jgi:hypothetical protein
MLLMAKLRIRSSWWGCSSGDGARQDHVGVAGGFVEPQVDGDHRVQRRQHLVEVVACGRR